MGVYAFDIPDGSESGSCEMPLEAVFPNLTREAVRLENGRDVRVAEGVRELEPPTGEELSLLRRLDPYGFYLRQGRY
jgi:hypothetical protein